MDMQITQSRRHFLAGLSAAGAASLLGDQQSLAADSPPETTSVRLAKISGICLAPQYVAEELLHAEGFTEVRYVMTESAAGQSDALAKGRVDFTMNFAAPLVVTMDAGGPITVLAGVHPGCF
jgi:NitT/TauT family transport system substrate-binding protein